MKKISLYIMALLTMGFVSCNEDFETTVKPTQNVQESILQASDVQFTPATVPTINIADLIAADNPIVLGTVSVKDGAMADGMRLKAVVQLAKAADYSDAVKLEAESMEESNEICILPSKLQDAYVNNFTRDPGATTIYMRTNLYTVVGDESLASIGNPSTSFFGTYTVPFTPRDEVGVKISNAYYAIVKQLDGTNKEIKFEHSEENVYDDPAFTLTIDALKDEAGVRKDSKFAFVSEEDLAKYKAGDESVLLGVDNNKNLVKGGPWYEGKAEDGAAKYNVTLDMEGQKAYIEPEIIFYCYFLLGNNNMKIGEGDSYRNYMFYKSDETTFTYTTFIPNNSTGKSWLNVKIWERDAMLAGAEAKAWGYSGSGLKEREETGNLKTAGGWLGPKTEGWYTLTIQMDEDKNIHTYQWTSISEPTTTYTNISIIGTINGSSWDKDFELTQCEKAPHNWCLLDFELKDAANLKFRANKNWDTKDWGGDGSQKIGKVVYTLPTGTEDIEVPAGTYDFYLNDITGDWIILQSKK